MAIPVPGLRSPPGPGGLVAASGALALRAQRSVGLLGVRGGLRPRVARGSVGGAGLGDVAPDGLTVDEARPEAFDQGVEQGSGTLPVVALQVADEDVQRHHALFWPGVHRPGAIRPAAPTPVTPAGSPTCRGGKRWKRSATAFRPTAATCALQASRRASLSCIQGWWASQAGQVGREVMACQWRVRVGRGAHATLLSRASRSGVPTSVHSPW